MDHYHHYYYVVFVDEMVVVVVGIDYYYLGVVEVEHMHYDVVVTFLSMNYQMSYLVVCIVVVEVEVVVLNLLHNFVRCY
jgi:hypothetical protein